MLFTGVNVGFQATYFLDQKILLESKQFNVYLSLTGYCALSLSMYFEEKKSFRRKIPIHFFKLFLKYRHTMTEDGDRGPDFCVCPRPQLSEHSFVQEPPYVLFWGNITKVSNNKSLISIISVEYLLKKSV